MDPPSTRATIKNAWLGLRAARELKLRGRHEAAREPRVPDLGSKTDFVERAALVLARRVARLGQARRRRPARCSSTARASSKATCARAEPRRDDRGRASGAEAAGWFDLGGSYSQGDVVAEAETPGFGTSPKGLDGRRDRVPFLSGVYVNGRRLRWKSTRLQSGPSRSGRVPRGASRKAGTDARGPPDVRGGGWSATATWLVTESARRTIRPRRRL
jgi:hypothetical protein